MEAPTHAGDTARQIGPYIFTTTIRNHGVDLGITGETIHPHRIRLCQISTGLVVLEGTVDTFEARPQDITRWPIDAPDEKYRPVFECGTAGMASTNDLVVVGPGATGTDVQVRRGTDTLLTIDLD